MQVFNGRGAHFLISPLHAGIAETILDTAETPHLFGRQVAGAFTFLNSHLNTFSSLINIQLYNNTLCHYVRLVLIK